MATRTLLRTLFTHHTTLALLLGLSGALAVGTGACGGTGEGNAGAGASSGNGNGTGSGGQGGSTFTTSNTGTNTGVGGGCAGTTQEAALTPVSMIIMFDKSGSMASNNKWTDSTTAVKAFIQDPGTAGLGIAIQYFPSGNCTQNVCSADACEQPAVDAAPVLVEPAPTDTQEGLLITSINGQVPDGSHTPIYPALGGAIQWAADYMSTHPGEKAVVVFVTDGAPCCNGVCNENSNDIAALAAAGWATDGVYTYAVGLQGSNTTLMNMIATAGNTGQGIFISSGGTAAQDLLAALKAIQGNQLACNFQMPTSTTGDEIDPTKVNVTYTPGGGGMPVTIGQVSGAGACTASGGWYYDDPANPTQIILCPGTCQTVQADPAGKIQIVVGCGTQPAE